MITEIQFEFLFQVLIKQSTVTVPEFCSAVPIYNINLFKL